MTPMSEEDQYGQKHPIETSELIGAKLKELHIQIDNISKNKREAYDQATVKCPELLSDKFKLMFLRSEVFKTDLAANRITKYWTKRLDIFGPDRAFLPLTQSEALKDDKVALGFGFVKLVPSKDPTGRSIAYFDVSKQDKNKYERKSMTRAMWYVFHAALEDEDTQKKGVIILVIPRDSKLSQFDRKLGQMNADSLKGCIPIRMSAAHICHPPTFFSLIYPIIKIFMGERLRKRTLVHGGSEEHVLDTMASFGLTKDILPKEFGGDVGPFHEDWLAARRTANK